MIFNLLLIFGGAVVGAMFTAFTIRIRANVQLLTAATDVAEKYDILEFHYQEIIKIADAEYVSLCAALDELHNLKVKHGRETT